MDIPTTQIIWLGFLLLVSLMVALDLGVFHRKAKIPSLAESLGWSAVWFSIAMLFNVAVYYLYELNPAGWDMDTDQLREPRPRSSSIPVISGQLPPAFASC